MNNAKTWTALAAVMLAGLAAPMATAGHTFPLGVCPASPTTLTPASSLSFTDDNLRHDLATPDEEDFFKVDLTGASITAPVDLFVEVRGTTSTADIYYRVFVAKADTLCVEAVDPSTPSDPLMEGFAKANSGTGTPVKVESLPQGEIYIVQVFIPHGGAPLQDNPLGSPSNGLKEYRIGAEL